MISIPQIHQEYTLLESEIRFYTLEINFLLKILTREYGIMLDQKKIKALDAFWKEFEKYSGELKQLNEKIREREYNLANLYKDKTGSVLKENQYEAQLSAEFTDIHKKIKILKETLYDYLDNNHCGN